MEFFAWLDQLDKNIFTAIQEQLGVAWLDSAMLLLRNATTWIPLYLFVLLWIFKNASPHAVSFIVLTIITFAFCDFVSASVLKPLVGRLRPCYDTDVASTVRGLIGCGGRFSFPSSHAANHFGLATFWFLAIRHITGKRWFWLWLWAASVCFAQVYVGKHFPLDVLGGALLGVVVGLLAASVFKNWQPRWFKQQRGSKFAKTAY
jgi:membrane-associated phospholipid phosphatase